MITDGEVGKAPGSFTPTFVPASKVPSLNREVDVELVRVFRWGAECWENTVVVPRLTKILDSVPDDLQPHTTTHRVASKNWTQPFINALVPGSAPVSYSPRFWPSLPFNSHALPAGSIINGGLSIPYSRNVSERLTLAP